MVSRFSAEYYHASFFAVSQAQHRFTLFGGIRVALTYLMLNAKNKVRVIQF